MTTTPRMALLLIVLLAPSYAVSAQDLDPAPTPGPLAADELAAGPLTEPPVEPVAGSLAELPDPWASPEIAAPRMDEDTVRRPQAKGVALGRGQSEAHAYPWIRTSASLAGVVALIFLLAWGYRLGTGARTRLSLTRRPRAIGVIQVISRINLAPRQALHLVRVGPRLILVGATHDSLRTLSVIEDADLVAQLAGEQAQQGDESHLAEFQRCLRGEAQAYVDPNDASAADAPTAARVLDIKQKLSQTVKRLQAAVG